MLAGNSTLAYSYFHLFVKKFILIIILIVYHNYCQYILLSLISSFVSHRDDIEDEQYLFEGVKLTEAEYRELR